MRRKMSKIAQYLRLKDNHPTMIKLMKLYDCAEELGIRLSFHGIACTVEDRDRDPKLPFITIEDSDNREALQEWPPATEFTCRYENPAFILERDLKWKEEQAKREEEKLNKAIKEKAETEARAEQERLRVETLERQELARLKNKYGE